MSRGWSQKILILRALKWCVVAIAPPALTGGVKVIFTFIPA